MTEWWTQVWQRLRPGVAFESLDVAPAALWLALAAGLAVVLLAPLWRVLRVGVTVVHELGHGLVGVLVGRSFTGLVLRPDMSGHAVTVGAPRGAGRVVTTWAGYPAPALLAAALVWAAAAGWAPPVLGGLTVVLTLSLLRVRSWYTGLVMVLLAAGTGWLWWAGSHRLQALVLLAVGVLLLLGAWRHLGAVVRAPARGSDPGVLARLTPVPAVVWTLSFVVVLVLASWLTARELSVLVGG